MHKEMDLVNLELEQLAPGLMNTFLQRRDLYAKQLDNGSYICIKKPLTQKHVIAHLSGDLTLGAYVLDQESRAKYIVFDADDSAQFQTLTSMHATLEGESIPAYLEGSRRGGHLWIFFSQPVPGKIARKFGKGLAQRFNLEKMELFPKQDAVTSGPGSLIRLPFGIHRRTGERYPFLTSTAEPLAGDLAGQIRLLSNPKMLHPEVVRHFCKAVKKEIVPSPLLDSTSTEGMTLSERIKASTSVYDFVGRYVELSPSGQGKCPFHEDRVNSFAVNITENYWNCFAGCGGGSIIDFWMKYRNCDFTSAVRELAALSKKSS
jgi:hypothetical protein